MNIFHTWSAATISALAAIFGSLTGALASLAGNSIMQRHQNRRDLLAKIIFYREQLYSDFISESARALADAIEHNFQDPGKLVPAYALLSRIRLSSSDDVLAGAEGVIEHIFSTYSEPKLNSGDIPVKGKHDKSLRDFSDHCRRDLESIWREL
jgi:hypothetical protein